MRLESKEENDFIKKKLEKFDVGKNAFFWTAGNDIENQGVWLWAGENGGFVEFTDWLPGEPNQFRGRNEDCIVIESSPEYGWNDSMCKVENNYICEICQ